ncbi:hypothetical protein SPRG_22167, partial [Saprolegnia parasitica CBS 223.65]
MPSTDAWVKAAFVALAVFTLVHLALVAGSFGRSSSPSVRVPVQANYEPNWVDIAAIDALHAAHDDELLHLIALNVFCRKEDNVLIPWTARNSSDMLHRDSPHAAILAELRKCPAVDIYLNTGVRDHGYCEDAMAYTLHLQSRAIPKWVLETTFTDEDGSATTYFELCPRSAILFMNHYWEEVHEMPRFPSTKKIVLMPNSRDEYNRIWAWYNQDFNNPRGAKVLYTQHTTSDATVLVRNASQHGQLNGTLAPKNFSQLSVVHANGK